MRRRPPFSLPPLLLVLLVSACARGGGPSASGPSATGSTPAPSAISPSSSAVASIPDASPSIPSATASTPSPTPAALEDGKHFGFVHSVDLSVEPHALVLDLAYFLTGDAASQAAQDHGDEYPPPNDYYILNDNPKLRTLVLAPHVRLRMLDWKSCCQTYFRGDLAAFADGFAHPDPAGTYRGPTSPYWLWIREGQVVKIQEQYLP